MKPDAHLPKECSALPNFARADDVLRAAEVFWVRAARVINPGTGEPKARADTAFFAYLAAALVRLSEQVTQYRHAHRVNALSTWVQYTPELALPVERDLWRLNEPEVGADEAMRILTDLNGRWLRVFAELSERVTSPSGKELFESCRLLLEERARALSSACAQRHDS